MEEKTKFIIIALVGILTISIFINFQVYLLKKTIEKERNGLKSENETLARTIKEINQENQRLQERVGLLTKDLDKITKEKEVAQENYELANKTKEQMAEQLNSLNARLMKEGDEKQKIKESLSLIQESLSSIKVKNTQLKLQLKNLTERKALLEKRLASQDKENIGSIPVPASLPPQPKKQLVSPQGIVELPPIVVYSQPQTYRRQPQEETSQTATAKIALEGKILGVNKENNFVVIDLGLDSGVKIGDTLRVYRKDNAVATIEVIQARNRVSACDIKKEIKPIEAGDIVR